MSLNVVSAMSCRFVNRSENVVNPYSGTWLSNLWFSLERVAEGYLLAIVLGVPLGVLIGWSRIASQMVDPSIQWLRPIPITAWLPFSIALFGWF